MGCAGAHLTLQRIPLRSRPECVLHEKARGIGAELPHASAGGGSHGNFTGAMGILTLDGLGVRCQCPHA
jgi:hypothetical protein